MKRVGIVLAALIVVAAMVGCDNGDGATTKLTVGVSTAGNVESGVAMAIPATSSLARQLAQAVDIDLKPRGIVNFTPTSVQVYVKSANVFDEFNQASWGEWVGGGKEIEVSINRWIELVGRDRTSLLASEELIVEEEDFGTYIGMKVLVSDTVKVSGSINAGGFQKSFTDMRIAIGYTGLHTRLPGGQGLVIDSSTTASLELIFDAEHCMSVSYNTNYPNVPIGDSLYVAVGNPALIPYVASTPADVRKFRMSIAGVSSVDTSTWHLKGVAVFNGDGDLANVGWQPIMHDGFSSNGGGGPWINTPVVPRIVRNGDGTYDVGSEMAYVSHMLGMRSDLRLQNLSMVNGSTGTGYLRSATDSVAVTFQVSVR